MADLGAITLWLALALAAYSALAAVGGKLRGSGALVESSQAAMYATVAVLLVSTLSLVAAFIGRDFEISYVARHSDLAMPDRFTWVAFYAGNEGSLLYIAMVLSVMAAVAVWRAPAATREALPYTTGILMLILTFFLAVMAFMANPFDKLPFVPADGEGINPLLTHFGMFFHPPALMAGLVGISIPFAFALGALLARQTGDQWVDAGRVWGIVTWALLAGGLLLGSWWAYTILGWGGFWFWDPVENAAFMPWLALTAFIHSIMVQKRRGMFRMWNAALIFVAFGLALYGMFMNRGGSVPSVHSFGASSLGWVFLTFLALGVIIPFIVFFWRYPLLKSARNLDSMLSREAAFLVNNLLLLAIAFVTLWGTVYPLLSRLVNEEEITVARPFYDQVNGPLMLGLVFLMGVGPMLPWRRANWGSVRRALAIPAAAGLAAGAALLIPWPGTGGEGLVGWGRPYALAGFVLAAFVAAGILTEWYRGARARYRHSAGGKMTIHPELAEGYAAQDGGKAAGGILKSPVNAAGAAADFGGAFVGLIWANRPRYGGYIVHLAVLMVALGIVGASFFNTQKDVVLSPGETTAVDDYEIRYLGTTQVIHGNRTEFISSVEVYRVAPDGTRRLLDIISPNREFYPSFNMASTRAAIRSTPVEDFYVVPSENLPNGDAGFRILVNPLIWWMWAAGPVMVLGTVIALWPAAPGRVPARAPHSASALPPAGAHWPQGAPPP